MNALDDVAGYRRLGVKRVINAADTYTVLGGGRLPSEVRAAMVEAGSYSVDVPNLLERAGEHLARVTKNPAALVVNSASAGLVVATVAAVSRADRTDRDRVPANVERRRVVNLCSHHHPYDRAVLTAGAELHTIGYFDSTPRHELEAALADPRTAALLWSVGEQFERYAPPLKEASEMAHARGLPVIVDAAAQIPPVSNLWSYREQGGDVVVFSGGKGLKGPQTSALMVGSEEMIAACRNHAFPKAAIGRAMKTSKESIMGLVAAVERMLALDWDAEARRWHALIDRLQVALDPVNVEMSVLPRGRQGQACPRLRVSWAANAGFSVSDVLYKLDGAHYRVAVGVDEADCLAITINPYSVLPEEEDFLVEIVSKTFTVLHNEGV